MGVGVVEFRLLGAVAVATGSGELPLGPAKRRSLLAALLLRPNTAVPLDQLIDALWPEGPPARARTVAQGHVSRLRALLAQGGAEEWDVRLVTRGDAYVLEMPESLLDAYRFEELVRLARDQRTPDDAAALLREALALWRGPALVGVATGGALRVAADGLEEARISAVEQLARTYGEFGDHARAAALLHAEAVAHPMRESLAAALMRALYRAGRQSDAIDQYHRTRTLLADELGVDPGPALREAYAEILASGGAPDPMSPPPAAPAPAPVPEEEPVAVDGPDLLPRPPRGFVGRDRELAALTSAARHEHAVVVITGPAGVGKSAVTLHWAHAARDRYDGVLFADLRGFSDESVPETADVLREFLIALGVPARELPDTQGALAAAYRRCSERRRLLVVLDNARTAAQVRPLLPAGPHSAALVTSRLRLDGLAVTELARTVDVGVLDGAASTALLAAATGADDRLTAEPEAAARLTALCAGLPLALRVVAARVNARTPWTLASLADELADEQRRLALLDIDDTGVCAALRLTLRTLPDDARRLFHRLGGLPGPGLDRYAAAALTAAPPAAAAAALDRLTAAHLLTEPAPGQYAMHDLVRLYARGLAERDDADRADGADGTDRPEKAGESGEALVRLLDHYVRTALRAAAVAEPDDRPCCVLPEDVRPDLGTPPLPDRAAALRWYTAQRENLAAAVNAAVAAGHDERAWRLVVLQWPSVVGYVRDDWIPLLEQGLGAAVRLDNPDAEARVRALFGWVLTEEGRLAQALEHLEPAPALAARAGDPSSEATALVNLAVALDRGGAPGPTSLTHLTRAAELARACDDVLTELLALEHLARRLLALADHAAVLDCTERGLALPGAAEGLAPLRQITLRISRGAALLALGRRDEGRAELRTARDEAAQRGFEPGLHAANAQLKAADSGTATTR
ncbi:BTAD domain-containing putative transcriptional regulator [Streptomyces sp. VRA16 Mangrove soil]|uniref:AfsR/SARP family transcriptional regulator n=1 Tax=Streptomyces sp. VRA16 Mangrove soil TaxID=2817434 RepID=UPI001A9D0FD6|nr:BTAD domain-containing putative transcriptional regulator [Streptomyces sp. VRA16 Mangrove soil]MBO1333553.1 AfsR/SARP family transcriptional regulator [Streptomyces sp. VRA16 Mangrove soil]